MLGYGVCVGLILAGAGLLYGGLISKIFALLVFVAGLFHHIAMIIFQLVFVHPAINQFFDQMPGAIFVGRAPAEATRWTSLFPGYLSISWWVLGCLFYLIAGVVVAISSTAADDDEDEDFGRKKRVRDYDDEDEDDDEDDDDDDEEEQKRRRRRRKRETNVDLTRLNHAEFFADFCERGNCHRSVDRRCARGKLDANAS